mmetsp:Transcript_26545/g.35362  ORF Transcript_26545/g.35362 Transcript_26545/m.35362 type:complete len:288 (-) Transcript_26545:342-1205(-)
MGHTLLFDDTSDLGLETHIQHTISLIKNKELDIFHCKTTAFNKIYKPSRCSYKQVTSPLNLAELFANISTTVYDNRCYTRAVGEFTSFVVDLRGKLTGGSEDERLRVNTAATSIFRGWISTGLEHGHDDGEKETGSFTRTSLGTSHEVPSGGTDRHGILLNRSGLGVATKLSVTEEVYANSFLRVDIDRFWAISTTGLDRNVIVIVKVNAGFLLMLLLEQFTLNAFVGPHVPMESTLVDAGLVTATVSTAVSAASSPATVSAAATAAIASVLVAPATVGWRRGRGGS